MARIVELQDKEPATRIRVVLASSGPAILNPLSYHILILAMNTFLPLLLRICDFCTTATQRSKARKFAGCVGKVKYLYYATNGEIVSERTS
jgi:hypothetical protein